LLWREGGREERVVEGGRAGGREGEREGGREQPTRAGENKAPNRLPVVIAGCGGRRDGE